jgi:hypothetical protein
MLSQICRPYRLGGERNLDQRPAKSPLTERRMVFFATQPKKLSPADPCNKVAWLATSEDEFARSSGEYFYHQRPRAPNPIAADLRIQEELLTECGRISGIPLD